MQFYAVFVWCPNSDAQVSKACAGTDLDECQTAVYPNIAQWLSNHADMPLAAFQGYTMDDLLTKAIELGFCVKELLENEPFYC